MKITDVKKREVVHCQTEAEAIRICNLMHEAGLKWPDGTSYLDTTRWPLFKEKTCYNPSNRGYQDQRFYNLRGFKIIPSTEIEAELVPAPDDLFEPEKGSVYSGEFVEANWYPFTGKLDIKHVEEPTAAERHNTGKLQWSLVDFPSLAPMVEVLAFGAAKYSRDNWKQGLSVSNQIDSLLRHVTAIASNDDIDEESNLSHIGHAQCNLMFLAWTLKNKPELDDR